AEDRHRLYYLIDRHPHIQLCYVTGRGLEAVMPLLDDPALPTPDYVVCDVGATVVDGHTRQPIQPLQSHIETRWPGEQAIVEVMGQFAGLERQALPQERRCSYFCDYDAVTEAVRAEVDALGCDLLYSADLYLDVLPRGVNKGSSLRALIRHLELDPEEVLAAGDTLNDLSMLQEGFKAVAVGQSEPGLLEATRNNAHVLHAKKPGCGGILEAIAHFGFLGEKGVAEIDTREADTGKAELVVVYHRLPYEEYVDNGVLKRRAHQSPNGIIPTLLSFFADGKKGAWVAWTTYEPRKGDFEAHTSVDDDAYPNLVCSRVLLSKQDVDIFYKRFSKEAFWPTLHTFWERAVFRKEHWEVFSRVNRIFAEAAAREAAPNAVVWIHDYNLWLVPAYLRELRPDVKIAFFHHTYFPSADVFNVIPWRRQIVGSLLQCDYVGFHIPRQVENFVDVVRGSAPSIVLEREHCAPRFLTYGCAMGLENVTTALQVNDRVVRLGAHPVGLDVNRVQKAYRQAEADGKVEALRKEVSGVKMILSVERLDYTKGTLEKLLAFEQLLEDQPELLGKVTLMVICVPAAREMRVYAELQNQIEQAVGRINGHFSQVGWTPVQFFFRPVPFADLVAYYAMADVMWITPLRDGLNLVAKEYVAVQGAIGGRGVLVLSEFAGAAAELKGALLTNPHDTDDLASGLYVALNMGRAEAEGRLRQLYEIVEYYDLRRWGDDFLEAVNLPGPDPVSENTTLMPQ
ncbi:MAG: glucosylglycerol-phosphate synthase, partial [Algiphilus sp.]